MWTRTSRGYPQVLEHGVGDAFDRWQHHQTSAYGRRDHVEHRRVEPHRGLRRMGRVGEDVEDLAGAKRVRVGQVKGLAVESLFVADVVDRVGDEVNRHDVDLLAFDTDRRHPRRKHVAQTLDHLEEVVRTVDSCPSRRCGSHRPRCRDGRPSTASESGLGRCARTRAWSGSRGACRGLRPPRTCLRARSP